MKINFIAFFFLFILTIGCQKSTSKLPEPAFYFWKSNFKFSNIERKTFQYDDIKKFHFIRSLE